MDDKVSRIDMFRGSGKRGRPRNDQAGNNILNNNKNDIDNVKKRNRNSINKNNNLNKANLANISNKKP